MPPRDPTAVQLDFPLLVAELIDQLQLVGTVGLLNFLPEVRPTFIVGSRAGAIQVTASPIIYLPAEIFFGQATNPAVNTVVIDTGQLAAGDYDVKVMMSFKITASTGSWVEFEHRDAANAVSLSSWRMGMKADIDTTHLEFTLAVAVNERLRVATEASATGRVAGTIMAKRRPTP